MRLDGAGKDSVQVREASGRSEDGMTLVWFVSVADLNVKTSQLYSQGKIFMNSHCADSHRLRILFEVLKKPKLKDHTIMIWVSIADC